MDLKKEEEFGIWSVLAKKRWRGRADTCQRRAVVKAQSGSFLGVPCGRRLLGAAQGRKTSDCSSRSSIAIRSSAYFFLFLFLFLALFLFLFLFLLLRPSLSFFLGFFYSPPLALSRIAPNAYTSSCGLRVTRPLACAGGRLPPLASGHTRSPRSAPPPSRRHRRWRAGVRAGRAAPRRCPTTGTGAS